jgi:hypothetical protein
VCYNGGVFLTELTAGLTACPHHVIDLNAAADRLRAGAVPRIDRPG